MISFSFISITLIPMQKPKTTYAWFQMAKNPTYKSGHSRPKWRCCLTFPWVDVMGILWESSRSPDPRTAVCHKSRPKQGANVLKHLHLARNFTHEDRTSLFQRYHTDFPGSCSIIIPAFEQTWYLLFEDNKFFLPVFFKSSEVKRLHLKK